MSIDAIECQRNIALRIIARNADYLLALKSNQSTLREDVELFAIEQQNNGFADTTVRRTTADEHQTVDGVMAVLKPVKRE